MPIAILAKSGFADAASTGKCKSAQTDSDHPSKKPNTNSAVSQNILLLHSIQDLLNTVADVIHQVGMTPEANIAQATRVIQCEPNLLTCDKSSLVSLIVGQSNIAAVLLALEAGEVHDEFIRSILESR